jgi:TPR repeat protein
MRVAIAVVALASIARAEPCADPAACAKACSPRDATACTRAAEDYFDGRRGAPLDTTKSFAFAKQACDGGDVHGCALLGFHYQDGSGVASSPERALAIYDKACRGGSGVACFNLAGMYGGGHGVVVDNAKYEQYKKLARDKWTAACDGGHFPSCTALASMVLEDKDAKRALALCDRACAGGYRVGCVQGTRLRREAGAIAADAYVRELDAQCTAGEASGCGEAGGSLLSGKLGVAKDRKRALALLERGCAGGDAQSCMTISADAWDAHDTATTRSYALKACDRHVALACVAASTMTDEKAAEVLLERACRMGNADGCVELAKAMVVARRVDAAVTWAREACRMGRGEACVLLVERDLELPVPAEAKQKVYTQACSAGLKPACRHVKQ